LLRLEPTAFLGPEGQNTRQNPWAGTCQIMWSSTASRGTCHMPRIPKVVFNLVPSPDSASDRRSHIPQVGARFKFGEHQQPPVLRLESILVPRGCLARHCGRHPTEYEITGSRLMHHRPSLLRLPRQGIFSVTQTQPTRPASYMVMQNAVGVRLETNAVAAFFGRIRIVVQPFPQPRG